MFIYMSKRFTYCYPSMPVSFYIYTISQSPLWRIQAYSCGLYALMVLSCNKRPTIWMLGYRFLRYDLVKISLAYTEAK